MHIGVSMHVTLVRWIGHVPLVAGGGVVLLLPLVLLGLPLLLRGVDYTSPSLVSL